MLLRHSLRLPSILYLSAAIILISITGCDSTNTHHGILDIPLSAQLTNDDQATLKNITSQLPAKQRTLLKHYLIRMQHSGAQLQNAPSVTIGEAIAAQRQYQQQHPDDPMGIKAAKTPQPPYSIELIPIATPPALQKHNDEMDIAINYPQFSVHLANHSGQPIQAFSGTLVVNVANSTQPQTISIPLTQFEPAIATGSRGKLAINRSMKNADILEQISDTQSVKIDISTAQITQTDGRHISINQ